MREGNNEERAVEDDGVLRPGKRQRKARGRPWKGWGRNVFIRMVECHAGLEIAPYISYAMRRETLFSTSQKPRTNGRGRPGER